MKSFYNKQKITQRKDSSEDSRPEEQDSSVLDEKRESISEEELDQGCNAVCDECEKLTKEKEEWENRCMRALAEVENIRKRAEKDREEASKFGIASLARDMIEFLDNWERALKARPQNSQDSEVASFLEGLELISREFFAALIRHGIQKIDSTHHPFDPALHQAVSEIEAPQEKPGIVFETLQTGYTLNGRLLRAAAVIVTK